MKGRIGSAILLLCMFLPLMAQEIPPAPPPGGAKESDDHAGVCENATRIAQWTCERLKKSEHVTPPKRDIVESLLPKLKGPHVLGDALIDDAFGMSVVGADPRGPKTIPRSPNGFSLLVGQLSQESHLSSGLEYGRSAIWKGRVNFHVNGQWSVRSYQKYVLKAEVPRLFHRRWFASLDGLQRNYPDQDFFGIGPDSDAANRTTFSYDATNMASTAGVRLAAGMRLQAFAGLLTTNTGNGKDRSSVEQVFPPAAVPGFDEQSQYRYAGASWDLDYRDTPLNPVSGGYYRISWTYFNDHNNPSFSFRQYWAELRHYFPVFSRYRVLALRAMTSLTGTNRPNEIPFYMMSTLGGQQTLRGFSNARFRDQNFLLLNSEYRWEAFSQMDAVVFADAGKVFPLTNQIGLDNLESSYGFGLHFKTTRGPLFYVEFGFSNENQRIFFGFRPAF